MQSLSECVAKGGHSLTPQLSDAEHSSLGGALGAGGLGLTAICTARYGTMYLA